MNRWIGEEPEKRADAKDLVSKLCVARRSVDHVELVDLDTGSTIAWPADQPIERQVRRP